MAQKKKNKYKDTPKSSSQSKQNIAPNTKTPAINWAQKVLSFIDRFPIPVLLFLVTLIGTYVFWDYFTFKYVYFFKDIGSDEINGTLPVIKTIIRNVQEGNLSSHWSFYMGMGKSFGGPIPPDPYGFTVFLFQTLFTHLFGESFYIEGRMLSTFFFYFLPIALFAYGYFRSIRLQKYSSIIGAVAITFSGYMVMGSGWGHNFVVLFGIMLLYAYEQYYQYKRWVFMPFVVMYISGNAFYLYMFTLFLLLYGIFRMVLDGKSVKEIAITKLTLAGLGVIGFIGNLAKIIPSYISLFSSPRVSGSVASVGKGASEVAVIENFPEWITVIYRTLSTDLLGTGSMYKGWYNYLEAPAFYVGIFSLLLIPQLYSFLNKRQRIAWGVFLGFWLLSAFVPTIRYAIHAFVGNYYKGAYDFILSFALLLPAMFALDKIATQKRINVPVLIASAVVLLFLVNFPLDRAVKKVVQLDVKLWVNLLILSYTSILFLLKFKQFPKAVFLLLLGVVVMESIAFSSFSVKKRKAYRTRAFKVSAGGYNDSTVDAVKYVNQNDSTQFFRAEKDFSSGTSEHGSLNDAMVQGYYGTASYSSFNQGNYIRFLQEASVISFTEETQTRWSLGVRNRPLLQSLCGVKYFFTKNDNSNFLNLGYEKMHKTGDVNILRNRFALPLSFCYDSIVPISEFRKLSPLQKDLMFLRAMVVEDENTELKQPSKTANDTITNFGFPYYNQFVAARRQHTLAIRSFKQDEIDGDIELPNSQLLFFSIPFQAGWKAYIDQNEVEIFKANAGFIGIKVPEGKHTVKVRFRPPYYTIATFISYSTSILVLLVYIGLEIRKRRKNKLKLEGESNS